MAGPRPDAGLPAAVEALYDSIADSGRWPSTLELICRLADACLATIGVVDTAANAARFSVSWGDENVVGALTASYGADVPFYRAIPQMELDVPYTVDDIYGLQGEGAREAWLESAIARQWVMPNALDDFFWVSLMKRPARAGTIVVVTDRARRPIDAADLELMSLLAPHVRRAVTIGDLFEVERQNAALFRAVIEGFAHPVVVVGRALEILFANEAAEELLAARTLVSSTSGRLGFAWTPARDAIARAVEIGAKEEFALGPAGIGVPLARTVAPAVAQVMPLARRDPSARFATRAAAAIFVGVAGRAPLPAMQAIAALFGLTAAEQRVAGQIAAGRSRQEIAQGSGVSPTTVQSQLAAIFDKTGASDQRTLEALIRDLSPPARGRG